MTPRVSHTHTHQGRNFEVRAAFQPHAVWQELPEACGVAGCVVIEMGLLALMLRGAPAFFISCSILSS